jgi:amino acid transporter
MPIEEALEAETLAESKPRLARAMRFRDVLLFYIVTGFSVRWIANASAAGPSAVVIWLGACVVFYIPLVFTVLELSSRYPDEGGIYVWAKQAFGGFAGFITGWTYWASNLPYFPGLLYFSAANALFLAGAHGQALADNRSYFVIASVLGLGLAVVLNVIGLNIGKWLHNLGSIGMWLPTLALIALSAVVWARFGSVTPITRVSLIPGTHVKDIIFWSTVAFSLSGAESASMLGDEIENPRRTVPRALLLAAVIVPIIYILPTLGILVAIPPEHVTIISGFMQSIVVFTDRLHLGWIALACAALISVGGLGQCGAWFAASARLPFVAGIDQYLPPAFGRLHPRWGTPYVSLLFLAVISIAFIVLSQVGTGVQGAYNVMVSVSVISFFIPYLFMFAALIRVQRFPLPPGAFRLPGGAPVAITLGAVGFTTTAVSCILSLIPDPTDPNPVLSIVKVGGLTIVMVGIGVALYLMGVGRARRAMQAAATDK